MPVGHDVTDGEQNVKPLEGQLGKRVDEQGEASHDHLEEEPFGQVVAGVAGCAAEEQPCGESEDGHEEQRAPCRVLLRPRHKPVHEGQGALKGVRLRRTAVEHRVQTGCQHVGDAHDKKHLHGRERHLALAAQIVAHQVARPQQQLSQRKTQRASVHAPENQDALLHRVPADRPRPSLLSAAGTEIVAELCAAVGTSGGVLAVLRVVERILLPRLEAPPPLFQIHLLVTYCCHRYFSVFSSGRPTTSFVLPPHLFLQFQDAADALVDALLGEHAVLHGLDHGVEGFDEVLRTEHDVGSGQEGAHGGLGIGVLQGDGPHLHRVGDDDVLVAQLAAQFVLQDEGRHGGGDVGARHVGRGDVGRHNQLRAPLDAGLEGNHLARQHLVPRLQALGVAVVRVGLGVAVAGEVLDAARDAGIFQPLQIARDHRRGHLRVVAEGTGADDDVLRVGVHVGHGGKVDVEAVAVQVGADSVAAVVGVLRIARGTDGAHRLELLHVEVPVVGDACHAATLLVDAEQRRTVQGPNLRDEGRELRLVLDVVGIEDDAAHGVLLVHAPHRGVHGLQFDFADVVRTGVDAAGQVEVDGGVEALGAHVEQLSHLFAQRHPLQLRLHLVGRHDGVVVVVRRTRGEHACAANEGGGQHPKFSLLHIFILFINVPFYLISYGQLL